VEATEAFHERGLAGAQTVEHQMHELALRVT
jgi:hypothetical protein